MLEVIQKGGPLMYVILLCSILALTVVIERLYHLHRAQINVQSFMEKIAMALQQNRVAEAIELCEQTPGPVAHILRAALLKHDRSKEDIREAIEEAGLHEVPRLERHVSVLATVAHITPLLGLLGTVTGMVRAFQSIQEKATLLTPVSPGDLAGGIWEAVLTTGAGLSVAIPTFVAYNYLVSRVNGFVLDIEQSATDLMQLLTGRSE